MQFPTPEQLSTTYRRLLTEALRLSAQHAAAEHAAFNRCMLVAKSRGMTYIDGLAFTSSELDTAAHG